MAPSLSKRARSWFGFCARRCVVHQVRSVTKSNLHKKVKKITSRKLSSTDLGPLTISSPSRRRVSRSCVYFDGKQRLPFQRSPASCFSVVCPRGTVQSGDRPNIKNCGQVVWPPSFKFEGFAYITENILPPSHLRGVLWPLVEPNGSYQSPYTSDGRLLALCGTSKDPTAGAPHVVFEYGDQRVVRGGMCRNLEVFWVGATTGWGVRASEAISAGEFVCEYAGEVLRDDDAESRCVQAGLGRDAYLFDLSTPALCRQFAWVSEEYVLDDDRPVFVIDAFAIGSVARFINHACSPSSVANICPIFVFSKDCEARHVDARLPKVALFANRNIAAGEELRYDYAMQPGDVGAADGSDRSLACHCGSEVCRRRLY